MPASDYSDLYESSGRQFNVDPQLLRAIVTTESDGRPNAVSSAGAEGVAQLMPATARGLGVSNSFDPKQAIPAAAKLISENLDRYGNIEDAVRAYHGGTDQANWGPKTQAYLGKVSRNYAPATKEGGIMPQSAIAPLDDAFSAAFAPPSKGAPEQPANDAFSAAFAAPTAAPAQPDAKSPLSFLDRSPTVIAAKMLAKPIMGLASDIADVTKGHARDIASDFTAPLDRQASDLPQGGMSDQTAPMAAPLRALKTAGDVGSYLFSPVEGAARYILGRPIEAATGGAVTKEQIGGGASMIAQMAIGGPKGLPEAPTNRLVAEAPQVVPQVALQDARTVPDVISNPGAALERQIETIPVNRLMTNSRPVIDQPMPDAPTQAPNPAPSPWVAAPKVPDVKAGIPEKLPPKPLLPVLTQSGAQKQADRIIAHFAGDGPINPDTSEIVPGSTPTLAHATGNPGIATLERGFMDANPGPFAERTMANDTARTNLIQDTIGTPEDIEAAVTARDNQTAALRDAAFAPGNVDKADSAPVAAKIKEILASPSGQRDAVQSSLNNILAKIQVKDPETGAVTLQTDPEQLYGIRKAIGDALSPLSAGTAADGRQAARELGQVQDSLDKAIESGAPGFSKYIDAYSAASRPIDGMKYLQGLNLTDPTGKITLAKVDSALKTIQKQQQAGGAKTVKSVSDEQLANLTAVRNDLRRQANIYKGKSLGSSTFQNLATNAATGLLGHPLVVHGTTALGGLRPEIGIPLIGARFAGNKLANRGEAMVQRALQNRLLNP